VNFLLQGAYSHGLRGLFVPLTAFTAVMLLLLTILLRKPLETQEVASATNVATPHGARRSWVLGLILLSLACGIGGGQLIWSLSERVAHVQGYGASTIGSILSVAVICQVFGSTCAAVLERRLNLPVFCGLGMLGATAGALLVGFSSTPVAFGLGFWVCNFAALFLIPLGMGTAALYDSSGPVSVLAGATTLIAGGAAPIAGGLVFDMLSPTAVLWVVAGTFLLGGAAAFCVVAPLQRLSA
jgi:predicted MFS family arabinose efflux permease